MMNWYIPKIDHAVLLDRAFENHAYFGGEKTLEDVNEHDMNHILLNYIRHRLIEGYDLVRFEDQWQYFSWFAKISRDIAKVYPFLSLTVEQQIGRKESKIALRKYERDGWEEL